MLGNMAHIVLCRPVQRCEEAHAAVPAWWSQQRQAWRFPLKTWRLALSSPDSAADRGCAWLPPQGWCWLLGAAWLCAVLASLRPTSPSSSPSSSHPCSSLSCVRRDARGGRAVVSLSAVRGLLASAGGGERGLPSGRGPHVVSRLSSFTAPLSVVCVPSALSRVRREWGCRRAHAAVSPPCR